MATNETSYVTRQLFWNGPSNFEYTSIFEKLVLKCKTFIDIGSNTGYYSLIAAKVNPEILVLSFEPSSGPSHFLQKNIQINNVANRVIHFNIALSDKSGTVDFFEIKGPDSSPGKFNLAGVGTTKKIFDTQKNSIAVPVKAYTLDNVLREQGFSSVDLIKIDTEGTENMILEGAAKTISSFRPIIICEILFNQIEDQVERIMRGHNYLFYNYFDRQLHLTSSIIREKDDGVRDCFFVPAEKTQLIREFVAG
jgi:FkbM family methyltransferase